MFYHHSLFPVGISEAGGRPANEDALWPDPTLVAENSRVFVVCDGVGGLHKGSLASNTTSRIIGERLASIKGLFDENAIRNAVIAVYHEFDHLWSQDTTVKGMATTLAVLLLDDTGAWVAHLGDSRVYHIREGETIWRTRDHSFVEELLQREALTEEEARDHPHRHVITKAIQAGGKWHLPDICHLTNLQPGDWFLLCSDGVGERIPEIELPGIWTGEVPAEEALESLGARCRGISGDNFSAWLVPVRESCCSSPIPLAELREVEDTSKLKALRPGGWKQWLSRIFPFHLVDDE